MTVLALESDPTRAAMIRQVVHHMVREDVTVVPSLDGALQALQTSTPDVLLLPALLSPVDEADLVSALRELPDAGHVEMLITPTLSGARRSTVEKPRAWLRWGWSADEDTAERRPAGDPVKEEKRRFAEQIRWTLQLVREKRELLDEYQESHRGTTRSAPAASKAEPSVKAPGSGRLALPPASTIQPPAGRPQLNAQPGAAPRRANAPKPARSAKSPNVSESERRQHRRILGPFEGCRRGLIDVPITFRDISEGGCFVNSVHAAQPGQKVTLTIEVPGQGPIPVNGLVVHAMPGYGFAVRFVDVAGTTRQSLTNFVAAQASGARN